MLEIDKLLIANPDLWQIYDDEHIVLDVDTQPIQRAKQKAFLYLYFNVFEAAFSDFQSLDSKSDRSLAARKAWERWIINLFARSSQARELFQSEPCQTLYTPAFTRYMNDLLSRVSHHIQHSS